MTTSDRVIWSNHYIDYEDWREYLESEFPELTDDQRYYKMLEINDDYLNDERVNLNIQLSEPILLIADLGLWDGHHSGYKEIKSGNIRDCLYPNHDYATFYVDRLGDLRCEDIHHDGTNRYLFRVFKEGTSDEQRYNLEEKLFLGKATRADITRITRRLGDEIGKVYGWSFPQHGRSTREEAR